MTLIGGSFEMSMSILFEWMMMRTPACSLDLFIVGASLYARLHEILVL